MPAKKKKAKAPKKEEVKPGLLLEEKESGAGFDLVFHNGSRDKQYIITLSNVKQGSPGEKTQKEGEGYKLSIHPGEVFTMLTGIEPGGYKKAAKGGPPDQAWLKAQQEASDREVDKDIQAVKKVLKAQKVQRVTAENTAKACADAGIKFLDVTFPPRSSSLKPEWLKRDMKTYPWKRPDVFLEGTGLKPALFVGEIEPNDIDQGALADCYLMGALSAVAEFERLVRACFENGQDPDLGLYRVSICKNGWWQTVCVDDFMPCSGPKPAYARNRDEPNELWVTLVEKAYAKVHGSFGAIMTGGSGPALGDLTGCPYKTLEFTGEDATSFEELLSNDEHEFLQVLGTPGKNIMYLPEAKVSAEEKAMWDKYQGVGLVCEHSYSLIRVVRTKAGDQLCFIRNPWGNDVEWSGAWHDQDERWTPELRKEVAFEPADDGSFWMAYDDVKQWFTSISINYCHGTWDQIRCAGNFEKGCADLVLEVKCTKKCRVWWGLHQKDIRGCKPGTPDASYTGMDLFVVVASDGKNKAIVNTGTKKRDVYNEATLEAGQTAFMLGQPKDAETSKSFVYSMLVEEKDNVEVTFRTAAGKRYAKAKDFVPGDWQKTEAQYQIKGQFSTNGCVAQRQGKAVDFSGASEEALEKERANFKATMQADRKRGEVSGEGKIMYTLDVGIIEGKGLAAKDETGKSDPYCEVKLRAIEKGKVQGSHRHPQKQVTEVCEQTLEPKWNATFQYDAAGCDAIRVQCFDKDEVGKESLGYLDIIIPELVKKGMKAGGAAVKEWYTLVGEAIDGEVSGQLSVSVKITNQDG